MINNHNMSTLKNLVDLYEEKVTDDIQKNLLKMPILDEYPKGLQNFNVAIKSLQPKPGETIHAMVPVGEIWGDSIYNRVDRIHYGNIAKNLKSRGGFSYKSAGVISLFRRPDGKLVATKGNHRVTKAFAVTGNRQQMIPAEITFHTSADIGDIIKTEAQDHNVDCNYRTSQATDDRFKAAYHAGERWAVDLYEYLDKFGIGIAGTNDTSSFEATSYRQITKSLNLNENACSRYLSAFTSCTPEEEVGGIATFAGTSFLVSFRNAIKFVDENNNVDSITAFIDYIYNQRSNFSHGFLDNVTQGILTAGNAKFKGEEVNVARLVSLYNEYCLKVLRAKIPTNNNTAIGYSSNEYLDFIKNAEENVRSRVDEVARQTI